MLFIRTRIATFYPRWITSTIFCNVPYENVPQRVSRCNVFFSLRTRHFERSDETITFTAKRNYSINLKFISDELRYEYRKYLVTDYIESIDR